MIISIRLVPPAEERLLWEIRTEKGTLSEVVCPAWDHGNWRDSLSKMKTLYAGIFAEAVRRSANTLIMPLLGEENDLVPAHRSAEALFDAACRSDFDGKCIVEIIRYPEPTSRVPHLTFFDMFRKTYFERPEQNIYMRVSGDGIESSDRLSVMEEGTGQDMHELYCAPHIFVMKTAGVLPDGSGAVIFRLLENAAVTGSGIPFGYYKEDTLLIGRIRGGRGQVRMTIPKTSRTLDICFFTEEALRDTFEGCMIGGAAGGVTHGHPPGQLPAAFLRELIHRITYRMDGSAPLREIVKNTRVQIDRQYAGTQYLDEFDAIIRKAVRMAEDENLAVRHGTRPDAGEEAQSRRDAANIHTIGEGWAGEEALAAALYCVLRYPDDFQKALCIAANHSGDSDSAGAAAGSILGAYLGLKKMRFRIGLTPENPLLLEKIEKAERMKLPDGFELPV